MLGNDPYSWTLPTLISGYPRSRAPRSVCSSKDEMGISKDASALPMSLDRDPAVQAAPMSNHLNCLLWPGEESPSGKQNGIRRWDHMVGDSAPYLSGLR